MADYIEDRDPGDKDPKAYLKPGNYEWVTKAGIVMLRGWVNKDGSQVTWVPCVPFGDSIMPTEGHTQIQLSY